MKFVVTLKHPPAQCFAREENLGKYQAWLDGMIPSAKELGVKVEGAFVSPNEHTFYFILDADKVSSISKFLGPPMMEHNKGNVSPVIPLEETTDLVKAFEK